MMDETRAIHAAFNGFLTRCACGAEYIVSTVRETQDPNRLCPTCLEDWEDLDFSDGHVDCDCMGCLPWTF